MITLFVKNIIGYREKDYKEARAAPSLNINIPYPF